MQKNSINLKSVPPIPCNIYKINIFKNFHLFIQIIQIFKYFHLFIQIIRIAAVLVANQGHDCRYTELSPGGNWRKGWALNETVKTVKFISVHTAVSFSFTSPPLKAFLMLEVFPFSDNTNSINHVFIQWTICKSQVPDARIIKIQKA